MPAGDRAEPVGEVVDPPLVDIRAEGQREVPLRGGGPRRSRAWLEEPLELLADLVRRQDRDEHPMTHTRPTPLCTSHTTVVHHVPSHKPSRAAATATSIVPTA